MAVLWQYLVWIPKLISDVRFISKCVCIYIYMCVCACVFVSNSVCSVYAQTFVLINSGIYVKRIFVFGDEMRS